jgi:hypothetical protein
MMVATPLNQALKDFGVCLRIGKTLMTSSYPDFVCHRHVNERTETVKNKCRNSSLLVPLLLGEIKLESKFHFNNSFDLISLYYGTST